MQKKLLSLLFLIITCFNSWAKSDTTVIYGTNIDYANSIIKAFTYDDFITRKLVLLATDTADSKGNYKLEFSLNETKLIYIPLGYYNGMLYTHPNSKYEVMLPERRNKSFADILNPYFQEVDFFLGVKGNNPHEINRLIFEFDDILERYVDENYYEIYRRPIQDSVDLVIDNIEKLFDTVPDNYFKNYRTYKYALLKYSSYMRNNLYVTKDYFNEMPVLYQNVSYMDLFNQLYTNYLLFYMNKSEGERLYSDIVLAKSPALAKETFSNNLVLTSDSIQELVLLKGLHDACHGKEFPFASLIITLDSIANSSPIIEHRKIAKNIISMATQTKVGYQAPNFELRDALGPFRKRTDYLANYIYLNFCSVKSFACQQDFELLKALHEKYKTEFKIISISIDDDFDEVKKYFKDRGYEWTLLSYMDEKEVVEKYKIRAYPTYYLIGPKGKFIMSPALSPGENFEYHYFNYMRNVKRQDLRNNR